MDTNSGRQFAVSFRTHLCYNFQRHLSNTVASQLSSDVTDVYVRNQNLLEIWSEGDKYVSIHRMF